MLAAEVAGAVEKIRRARLLPPEVLAFLEQQATEECYIICPCQDDASEVLLALARQTEGE